MTKRRFEQRLEDYRNGKGKKKSPVRRLRALGIIAGLAFVVYCCVASLVNQEEVYAAPSRPYAPKADTREKRQADGVRPFREGASWGGQWRASSEPGGIYMEGKPLVARRRPAYLQGDQHARTQGYHVTTDSISVDPIRGNCSSFGLKPPKDYPRDYLLTDIVQNWPPDSILVPPRHFASLCRFDYRDPVQIKQAEAFREAEVPFIVEGHSTLEKVSRDWSTPGFLERRLGTKKYKAEKSDDNHFMYYGGSRGNLRGWRPPTNDVRMTYNEWLSRALIARNTSILDEHYYFRVSPPDTSPRDIPVFAKEDPVFMPYPRLSKGVHCRFGYAGIIAEAHFDGSRNIVVELGGPPSSTGHANSGRRRYVMAKPSECANTYLLPKGHPSGRHSAIDWSRPVDLTKFPLWSKMRGFEVILEPGDALYIPSFWLHYIVSLGTNFQCNARSGHSEASHEDVKGCGF